MTVLNAKVKAVLSADTLILVPPNSNPNSLTPPKERQLSLAYVQAPKLSLNEPYSFQARELLRTLLVGKTVSFNILYTLPGLGDTKREFGDVKTPIFDSLIEYLLAKGGVRLKHRDSDDPEYEEQLATIEDHARTERAGLWGPDSSPQVVADLDPVIAEKSKSAPIPAIVEKVISGDRLICRILAGPKRHVLGPVLIGGIVSPHSSEKLGISARYYVEKRLLLQNVKVSWLGQSASGVNIVRIHHPAGNIAQKLVESGLAEVADWQSEMVGITEMKVLRAGERSAKVSAIGLWAGKTVSVSSADSGSFGVGKTLTAIVARVMSSDTVVLRVGDTEKTVQLASLRAPRLSDPEQAPFVPLSKEFVRKMVIGKQVQVVVDGVREKSEMISEDRPLVSVYLKEDKSLGSAIVEAGWAGVVRHKRGDENKSSEWDNLIALEKISIDKKTGIHGKLPPAAKVIDASENSRKSKTFFTSLSNRTKIPAVVDYVSAPHRFKLVIPKENLRFTLVLGGLAGKSEGKSQVLDKAALDYTNRKSLQRDVTVDIYGLDKVGGFIGNLFLPGQKTPYQVNLVEQGFYELHEYSVEQTKFGDLLWEKQEEAQKNKLGIWASHKEPSQVTKQPGLLNTYHDIEVTDISDEGHIAFQFNSSDTDRLIPFMKQFHEFHSSQPMKNAQNSANSNAFPMELGHLPKKGELVSVQYSSNGKFYRGKILDFDKTSRKYKVLHIDFGNTDFVSASAFRQLPSQFNLDRLAAQGHVGVLSLVHLPPSKPTDYLDDSLRYLDELILGKKMIAIAHVKNPLPGVEMSFALYDSEKVRTAPNWSVNKALVKDGWAIVNKSLSAAESPLKSEFEELKKIQAESKKSRLGCWEMGDIEEDIED